MKRSLALVLLVCLLLTAVSMPVLAQGGTVLAVDPPQSSVEVNGQREISLYVTDADNLNAFDVQVEYNSALLSLVKWEFGDLLSNLAVVKRDDLPGSFRLVATQLATPGVSGDGVLFKMTFSGKLTGSSAIMITKAEFARSEGGLSLPEIVNGSITIIPAQPTATATLTPIPTATATLAPTATATKQPTATQAATSVPSATATATRAATSTPAPTRTAGSQQTATTGAVGGVGATDEPTPAVTQPEPGKATAEGGGIAAGPTGQSGVSGSSGGNGYFLQRSSRYSPNTAVMILFVGGLLAIGAAVVIYANRKKRI